MAFDTYGRISGNDQGSQIPGALPAAGLNPGVVNTVPVVMTAAAGTALDILYVTPVKCQIIDVQVQAVTVIATSVVQVFTAATGGGTAASSSIATSVAGRIRDALTTAPPTFAAGSTIFIRQSGGATLAGGTVYLSILQLQ